MGASQMQNQTMLSARRNAPALRREMTDAERKLWSRLRGEQLGAKFRRQHPLGGYVADFACLSPKLIIELDGSQHADQKPYDERRDEFFKSQGFVVLRFAADAPFVNIEGVLRRILDQLTSLAGAAPTPTLPQRGREKNTQAAP